MRIDLDEIDKFDKTGCEHSGCTFGIHTLPKIIAELRAAREVCEAANAVIESLNPMFIETDAVIVKLHDAIKTLEQARRG